MSFTDDSALDAWMRDKWVKRVEGLELTADAPPKPVFNVTALFTTFMQFGVLVSQFSATFGGETITSRALKAPVSIANRRQQFEKVLHHVIQIMMSLYRPTSHRIVLRSVSRAEYIKECAALGVADPSNVQSEVHQTIHQNIFMDLSGPTAGPARPAKAPRLQYPDDAQPAPPPPDSLLFGAVDLPHRTASGLAAVLDTLITAVLGFILGAEGREPVRLCLNLMSRLVRDAATVLRGLGRRRADSKRISEPAQDAFKKWRVLVENVNICSAAASVQFSQSVDERIEAIRSAARGISIDSLLLLAFTKCVHNCYWLRPAEKRTFATAIQLLDAAPNVTPPAVALPPPAAPLARPARAPVPAAPDDHQDYWDADFDGRHEPARNAAPLQTRRRAVPVPRLQIAQPQPTPDAAAAPVSTELPAGAATTASFVTAGLLYILSSSTMLNLLEAVSMQPQKTLRVVGNESHRILQKLVQLAGHIRRKNTLDASDFFDAFASTAEGRLFGIGRREPPDAAAFAAAVLNFIGSLLSPTAHPSFIEKFQGRTVTGTRCTEAVPCAEKRTLGRSTFCGASIPVRFQAAIGSQNLQTLINTVEGMEKLGAHCDLPRDTGRPCGAETRSTVRFIHGTDARIDIDRFGSGTMANKSVVVVRSDNVICLRASNPKGGYLLRVPYDVKGALYHSGDLRSADGSGWSSLVAGSDGGDWWECSDSRQRPVGPGPHELHRPDLGHLSAILLKRTTLTEMRRREGINTD